MPILSCPVPETISTLNPNGFLFSVQKFPELEYFVQEAALPAITLGQAVFGTSVHDLKLPGEALEFDDLTISFLIDEKMANYIAIQEWMFGLGFPEGHKYYTELMNNPRNSGSQYEATRAVSDCFLTILNSDNLPLKRYNFVNAFPTNLSALTFQSNNSDVTYIVATLTLAYEYYVLS
jgi:hypothetical protein